MLSPTNNIALTLNPACSLKRLENPCLYNKETDELYELSESAFAFLAGIARGDSWGAADEHFLAYCLEEGILVASGEPAPRTVPQEAAPTPSLRYLEIQLTTACNLRCRHCYVAGGRPVHLPLDTVRRVLDELVGLSGLCVLLSGGEPLLYPHFWELNEILPTYDLRFVLLTNGLLLDAGAAAQLKVQEVQVSLDGMEEGHERLRGPGTFARACAAIDTLVAAGKRVAVATMVHRYNIGEFPALEELLRRWGIEEWNVDAPVPAGQAADCADLLPEPALAAQIINRFATGGGHYQAGDDWACGAHLATLTARGHLTKCAFYPAKGEPVNAVGLRAAWEGLPRVRLTDLSCRTCEFVLSCRGGCRYRAAACGNPFGPDPVYCCRYGKMRSGKEVKYGV